MRSEDRHKIKGVPWRVRDKTRFLTAVMTELAGSAHISFEGDLSALKLYALPGASDEKSAVLKRNTTWPRQGFVVVPLEPSTESATIASIGGIIPGSILYVQIEKMADLNLGATTGFIRKALPSGMV
jgi:hypothetical protein